MACLVFVPVRSTRRRAGAAVAPFVWLASALALASSALEPSARADLGPPRGWVDCTLEARRAKGEECLACGASARDPERCGRALSAYDFEWACRQDRAAIVWTELWCRAPSASAKKVPPEILDDLANASAGSGPPAGPEAPAASAAASVVASDGAPAALVSASASAPAVGRPPSGSEPLSAPPPVARPASGCGACAAMGSGEAPAAAPFAAAAAALAALARRLRLKGRARG